MVSISTWFWIKTRELCTDHGKLAGSVKLLNYIVQASGRIPSHPQSGLLRPMVDVRMLLLYGLTGLVRNLPPLRL